MVNHTLVLVQTTLSSLKIIERALQTALVVSIAVDRLMIVAFLCFGLAMVTRTVRMALTRSTVHLSVVSQACFNAKTIKLACLEFEYAMVLTIVLTNRMRVSVTVIAASIVSSAIQLVVVCLTRGSVMVTIL